MPKTRQQKEDTVVKLTEKLEKSNSVVFADYQGLNMSQLSELRASLAENSAEFSITKNNLLKLALRNSKIDVADDALFEGPTATLFAYGDEIAPIKALTKMLKDLKIGSVKAGIMEGELIDQYKVNRLASLPSRDELRAKVVGSLGSPLYGIVGVLQANLRNLVYALEQIRVSRGGE